MSTLGRWLADILNAHIERHNVPVAEQELLARPMARHYVARLDLDEAVTTARRDSETADAMRAELDRQGQLVVEAQRPCWACGDAVGFYAEHSPCTDVPAFKPNPKPPWVRIP